jgi:hypothetical protein
MKFISKYRLSLVGMAVGAMAGFAYYRFVGCNAGTCPITSHPLNSSAYGGLIGALLFTSFKKEKSNVKGLNDEESKSATTDKESADS